MAAFFLSWLALGQNRIYPFRMSDTNLWSHTCAEDFRAPKLSDNLTADLIVVGGGFTGCSAALEAAGQGARVVLLEAQTIGHGGSGRNVGLVNAGLWLPPDDVMQRLGQAPGIRLNTALAAGPEMVFDLISEHQIDCEPVRNGTLHCAHSPAGLKDLEKRYAQQAERKAPVALLDAKDAFQATGSEQFFGALKDDRAGTIQPLAYAKGLARAASERGALIFENTPVQQVKQSDHWIVETASGSIKAPAMIVATNAYHTAAKGIVRAQMSPVHYFQLATKPLPDKLHDKILPNGEGCWDTGLVMTSFRKDQAGRFILGAMGLPDTLGLHKAWAHRALARLFPDLSSLDFEFFWSGRIGMSKDYLPKVLSLGNNGYSMFGFSGRGISPGTVFGQALAKAALSGNANVLPLQPITDYSDRWSALKGAWIETGARLTHALKHR